MDLQVVLNVLFAICGALVGWVVKMTYDAQKELRKDLRELEQLAVKKDDFFEWKADFDRKTDAVFKKLDRIEDKLDGKKDKNDPG